MGKAGLIEFKNLLLPDLESFLPLCTQPKVHLIILDICRALAAHVQTLRHTPAYLGRGCSVRFDLIQ